MSLEMAAGPVPVVRLYTIGMESDRQMQSKEFRYSSIRGERARISAVPGLARP
jgi:hypothetical protein